MRNVEINLEKQRFTPGELIKGTLVVTTDEHFESKNAVITLAGILTAKGTSTHTSRHGMTSTSTDTSYYNILNDVYDFNRENGFESGTHKIGFQFELPKSATISYVGPNGEVKYNLDAEMKISWRSKLRASSPIVIFNSISDLPHEPANGQEHHENDIILDVKVDSTKYCIGSDISFMYLVNTDMKFKQIRFRVEHREVTTVHGKGPVFSTKVLCEEKIPEQNVVRNQWNNHTLKIDTPVPPTLLCDNINSTIVLEVTIGRSFRLDKCVEIPLISGYCP